MKQYKRIFEVDFKTPYAVHIRSKHNKDKALCGKTPSWKGGTAMGYLQFEGLDYGKATCKKCLQKAGRLK